MAATYDEEIPRFHLGMKVVGLVEVHSGDNYRSERWVSLTLHPSYAEIAAQPVEGSFPSED